MRRFPAAVKTSPSALLGLLLWSAFAATTNAAADYAIVVSEATLASDDFILVPNPRTTDPAGEYIVRFTAKKAADE